MRSKAAPLRVLKRNDDAINCVAWHPSGNVVAAGGDDGFVTLYEAKHGKALRHLQRPEAVAAVTFAHDGSLAVGGADGHVAIYDKNYKLQREIAAGEGIRSVAFAPKTTEICVGGEGGVHLTYFDQEGKRKLPFPGRSLWVWSLCFSHDGSQLAVGGDDDSSIALITTRAPEVSKEILRVGPAVNVKVEGKGPFESTRDVGLSGHPAVRCLAFAPDGFSLAAGGLDCRVVVYYLPAATVRITIQRQGPVWAVAYSRDGHLLAIGGADERVALHDVATGAPMRVVPALAEVRCLAFSQHYLASGDASGMLVLHPVQVDYTGPRDDAALNKWETAHEPPAFGDDVSDESSDDDAAATASDDDDAAAAASDSDSGVVLPPIGAAANDKSMAWRAEERRRREMARDGKKKTGLAIIADKW